MSGANHKVFNRTIPQGIDDGILTALEISILNFRGLDLITLSACETGLGKIDLDGVFGLQRGLKMADANSILMSLWKVDDEATCALMIDFYSHWLSGESKHEALRRAVDKLRANPKWASPKYWAAFILLDGIN
jgi:CHAT domain-containing protein